MGRTGLSSSGESFTESGLPSATSSGSPHFWPTPSRRCQDGSRCWPRFISCWWDGCSFVPPTLNRLSGCWRGLFRADRSMFLTSPVRMCSPLCSSGCSLRRIAGTTIEQFIISHKIERIKELIIYGELNITEIAWKMNYSSVAHLSNQFKKVTGLTPSHFKQLKEKRRTPIEEVGNLKASI